MTGWKRAMRGNFPSAMSNRRPPPLKEKETFELYVNLRLEGTRCIRECLRANDHCAENRYPSRVENLSKIEKLIMN